MNIHRDRFNFTIRHNDGRAIKFHAQASRMDAQDAFQRVYGYYPAQDAFLWVERYVSES